METTYYVKINIEEAGTAYSGGGISQSLAGHMWYEIYQKVSFVKFIKRMDFTKLTFLI